MWGKGVSSMLKTGYKKFAVLLVLLLFILSAIGCSSSNSSGSTTAPVPNSHKQQEKTISSTKDRKSDAGSVLKVHFIDVGQADSILVQTPSGKNILIDGGNNDDADLLVNYLKDQDVKTLDYVIGTHPHEDHIGGLDVVIEMFEVEKVYLPKVSHTTKTYKDLLLAVKDKGVKIIPAKAGVKPDIDSEVKALFVAPNGADYEEINNYSVVFKLTYGNTSFLFTGDAEALSENEMLKSGFDLKSDVLKVAHHGSSSSTTPEFLKAVSPKYAVISVGTDNDYGHPSEETLLKLNNFKVKIYRTDMQGTIIATSDGESIKFNKSAITPKAATKNISIIDINLRDEVVIIKNSSPQDVNMTGWTLISAKGNQIYHFPEDYVLKSGAIVRIWSGKNARNNPPGDLFWTNDYIWNNDGDTGILKDADGYIVSSNGGN